MVLLNDDDANPLAQTASRVTLRTDSRRSAISSSGYDDDEITVMLNTAAAIQYQADGTDT